MEDRFDLAPWELAPDSPEKLEGVASGRVKAKWLGDEREFLLREVEVRPGIFVVFARGVGSTEEGNWLLCDNTVPETYSSWRSRSNGAMNLFSKTQGRPLGRLFHLPFVRYGTPYHGFIVATGKGKSHLQMLVPEDDQRIDDTMTFRLPLDDLKSANAASWFERIQDELSDPDSDVRFSLAWRILPFEEAAERLVRCRRGSYTELTRVLNYVLAFYVPSSTNSGTWMWDIGWPDKQAAWLELGPNGRQHPISAEMELWQEAALAWFKPSYNEELRHKHDCVSQFVRDNEPLLTATTTSPNQHERLEAALELRDWALGKVPDELLQTLL